MIKRIHVIIVLTAATFALPPAAALAATALAVGVTGKPTDGIAFGYSYNYDSVEKAEHDALQSCRDYKEAPKAARKCKLFRSIEKGCLGVAFDPKDDSPGMGWAVSEKRDEAESRAIQACKDAAPASRRQFCKIDTLKCDGDESPKKDKID